MRILSTIPSTSCHHHCPGCYWQHNTGRHRENPNPFLPAEQYIEILRTIKHRFGHTMINMNPGAESVKEFGPLFWMHADTRLAATTDFYRDNWVDDPKSRRILDTSLTWFDVSVDWPKIRMGDFDPDVIRTLPSDRRCLSVLVYPGTALALLNTIIQQGLHQEQIHITYPKGNWISNSSEEQLWIFQDAVEQGVLPNASFVHNHYGNGTPEGKICDLPHVPFVDVNRMGEVRTCPYQMNYHFVANDPVTVTNQFQQLLEDVQERTIDCQWKTQATGAAA